MSEHDEFYAPANWPEEAMTEPRYIGSTEDVGPTKYPLDVIQAVYEYAAGRSEKLTEHVRNFVQNHLYYARNQENLVDQLLVMILSAPLGAPAGHAEVSEQLKEILSRAPVVNQGSAIFFHAYKKWLEELNALLRASQAGLSVDGAQAANEPRDEAERDYGAKMYQMGRQHIREEAAPVGRAGLSGLTELELAVNEYANCAENKTLADKFNNIGNGIRALLRASQAGSR